MRGWIGCATLLAMALGCASSKPALGPPPAAAELGEYRIQAGDHLDIRFPLNPELNVLTFVRPDGRISLKLVGEVFAEGRTPAELKVHVREAYSKELRDPEVAVIVRGMAARVYVDGQIERPGEYLWNPQITALQAIARAGGFRDTADEEHFVVLRRQADGTQQVIEIDLDDDEKARDVYLAPHDLVVVPATGVSDVNKWVDQYLRKNIPVTPREVLPGF